MTTPVRQEMLVRSLRLFQSRSSVRRAVRATFRAHREVYGRRAESVDELVDAVAAAAGRRITVVDTALPWGSFGSWNVHADGTELLLVARELPLREWTIAHELGHIMLGHADPVAAAAQILERGNEGAEGLVLARRSCSNNVRRERQAEQFAALLTHQLHHTSLL